MPRQFLLGMGTGGCGLVLLAEIWRQQPHCRATFQQPPLLPWESSHNRREIQERLTRWQQTTTERFVADVAAFYLPYAETALRNMPNLTCVCLHRPEDEVMATMTAALNAQSRVPLDHWTSEPTPLRQHDLNWSRTFPQYSEASREAGLRRYWRSAIPSDFYCSIRKNSLTRPVSGGC